MHVVKLKVMKSLGVIRRIKQNVPLYVLRMLYFTLIQPYFDYCNIVWSLNKTTVFDELFRCQKKAIRIITNSKWNAHSRPIFAHCNILPLDNLSNFYVACFMYRCLHNLLPAYFCDMFTINANIHLHNTRQKNNLHIVSHRLNTRKFTIRFQGPLIWNSINTDIRNSNSLFTFKKKLKASFLSTLSITESSTHFA